MGHQLGQLAVAIDDALAEFARVAGGEADALHARHFVHVFQQQREIGDFAVGHRAAVGVDVLAQQGDFLHALRGQAGDLGQHVVEGAADLLAAGIGHHAEGAVLGTAFHDGYVSRAAVHLGRRDVVEFFDFRKEISTCELPLDWRDLIRSGKRCSVCGPNTTST